MTPPFSSDRTALVRRNRFYMGLALSPLVLAALDVITAAATGLPQLAIIVPHLLIFGLVIPFFVWRKNPRPQKEPARIEAGPGGIFKDGALLVPRALVKDAFVMPRNDGALVVRVRRRGLRLPVDILVSDREEGRALLKALGHDVSQAAATFKTPSRLVGDAQWRTRVTFGFVGTVIVVAMLGLLFALLRMPFLLPIPIALYLITVFTVVGLTAFVPSRLRVGVDGVHYSWLRWKRFIPYGEMALIRQYEEPGRTKNQMRGIEITLQSGEVVRLAVQPQSDKVRDEIEMVEERIAEAVDTWRRGDRAADAARVARAGRDLSAWLRALRGIAAGADADARTAPILPDKLWRIVEDPAAPPDARAGAAVALGATIDEEGRARLLSAAEATAAPKLRFAMEVAAKESDDEALSAALAEVESAEEGGRKAAQA